MNDKEEAIHAAAASMDLEASGKGIAAALIDGINELLTHDFDKLISILYRMDVNEHKLRKLLSDHPADDAANIIAELMIERQIQKLKSKQDFPKDDSVIDENEKW